MNAHVHFHCCVIDGVFTAGDDGQVHFTEAGALTPEDLAAVRQQVRARVLRWFACAGHLDHADAREMAGWHHGGGFSLDASVRIDGHPGSSPGQASRRAEAPATLLRTTPLRPGAPRAARPRPARPSLPRPQPDGRTELRLTSLELSDRPGALIPPPRLHRHRYHAVLD